MPLGMTSGRSVIIGGGEVPEWTNGAVSKTVVVLWATEGSNPSLSATQVLRTC